MLPYSGVFMANPVTNLTAKWVNGVGIQLDWDEPTDISSSSKYEIYVLESVQSIAGMNTLSYVLFSVLKPVVVRQGGSYVLQAPTSSALFAWASVLALTTTNTPPPSVTLQIAHIASDETESDPVTVTAYPPQIFQYAQAPHLQNNFSLDPTYGFFAINEQDSYDEISSCVSMILGSVPGGRYLSPNFGIPDMPLNELNAVEIQRIVNTWEPRASARIQLNYDDNNQAFLKAFIQNTGGY